MAPSAEPKGNSSPDPFNLPYRIGTPPSSPQRDLFKNSPLILFSPVSTIKYHNPSLSTKDPIQHSNQTSTQSLPRDLLAMDYHFNNHHSQPLQPASQQAPSIPPKHPARQHHQFLAAKDVPADSSQTYILSSQSASLSSRTSPAAHENSPLAAADSSAKPLNAPYSAQDAPFEYEVTPFPILGHNPFNNSGTDPRPRRYTRETAEFSPTPGARNITSYHEATGGTLYDAVDNQDWAGGPDNDGWMSDDTLNNVFYSSPRRPVRRRIDFRREAAAAGNNNYNTAHVEAAGGGPTPYDSMNDGFFDARVGGLLGASFPNLNDLSGEIVPMTADLLSYLGPTALEGMDFYDSPPEQEGRDG